MMPGVYLWGIYEFAEYAAAASAGSLSCTEPGVSGLAWLRSALDWSGTAMSKSEANEISKIW